MNMANNWILYGVLNLLLVFPQNLRHFCYWNLEEENSEHVNDPRSHQLQVPHLPILKMGRQS